MYRTSEFFLGQLAAVPEHQQVFERRRHEVRAGVARAGEFDRIVLLVRVDDAAEGVASRHYGKGGERKAPSGPATNRNGSGGGGGSNGRRFNPLAPGFACGHFAGYADKQKEAESIGKLALAQQARC
jgi:hypothetical protein